ncbi:hypothetical protein AKJ09_03698 [Labilithrix luteola]|uniref:Uncharacterized protein n=1 Tax=Labilithrix luteola TaxID=1391654 RepID=A0A0K1PV77_9BACT|nr:hypothetical protein [Labilithrix luteola]AKU97034.1 hypothetical protein AKJ09_03698 [Labilithrix luteola]
MIQPPISIPVESPVEIVSGNDRKVRLRMNHQGVSMAVSLDQYGLKWLIGELSKHLEPEPK